MTLALVLLALFGLLFLGLLGWCIYDIPTILEADDWSSLDEMDE